MPPITLIKAPALTLRGADIDTDRIMPARFLKAVTFDGLEAHLFADDRQALARQGARHPFDDPARRRAGVLVVNANFGCGSSREHAPQALVRRGLRAVVGESFAEIFFTNALALGLPCVAATAADVERLMQFVDVSPDAEVVVDLDAMQLTAGDLRMPITIPDMARDALRSGQWDATGLLLERYEAVERTAGALPYLTNFELRT